MQDHLLIELCGDDHIVLDTDGTLPQSDIPGAVASPGLTLDTDGTLPIADLT